MYSVQSSNLKKNSSKKQKTNIKSSKLQWQSCPWWVLINCQGKAADPLSRWFTGSILSFLSPVCIEVDTCNCPYMWREMYFTGVFTLFGTFILWRPFIPSWKEKKVKNTCKVLDLITWDFPLAFALFFFGLTASIFKCLFVSASAVFTAQITLTNSWLRSFLVEMMPITWKPLIIWAVIIGDLNTPKTTGDH